MGEVWAYEGGGKGRVCIIAGIGNGGMEWLRGLLCQADGDLAQMISGFGEDSAQPHCSSSDSSPLLSSTERIKFDLQLNTSFTSFLIPIYPEYDT